MWAANFSPRSGNNLTKEHIMSRVGNKAITLPAKVSVKADAAGQVTVEGPRGKLQWTLPQGISLEQKDSGVLLKRPGDERRWKALHGTSRALINNMVKGVSDGFAKDLEIQGVGFR